MADKRPLARVVHGVGQVPDQRYLKSEARHLADSEGAVENTNIRVDAHQRHIGDAFLFEVVVDFLPVVADAVETEDVDRRILTLPGIGRASFFLRHWIVAAASGIVYRKVSLL